MNANKSIFQGLLYIVLGIVFVLFAVEQVNDSGWTILAYVIMAMAAIDFVTGARFIFIGLFKRKK